MRRGLLYILAVVCAGGLMAAGTDLFFGEVKVYRVQGKTASGEPFQDAGLTAAHKSLPFGTRLRVVNLENNRQVEVRVNDRIQDTGRFILTLSAAAGGRLGMVAGAHARVEVTVLGKGSATPPAANTTAPGTKGTDPDGVPKGVSGDRLSDGSGGEYSLQVGAFRSSDNATRFAARLRTLGYSARVENGQDGLSGVVVGPYPTRSAIEVARGGLAGEAPGAFIRKKI